MKSRNTVIAKPVAQEVSTVRILKRATCPSVSGKSSLCYEVGVDERRGDLQLRVVSNSGSGAFNQDWVKLEAIQAQLDKAPKGQTITSHVLAPLFRGVSQNTHGFFWAVLVHAGLVARSPDKPKKYLRAESTAFTAEIKALADGRKSVDLTTKKAKPAGDSPPHGPSASTKKKK